MLRIINPADGSLIEELRNDTPASIHEKAQRAREAQPAWAALPPATRIAAIAKFRQLLVARHNELCNILTREVGKPIRQSSNEIKGVLTRIDFFIDHVATVLEPETVFDDAKQKLQEQISHEPLGVIANISAWNYPYFVGANVFIPALLTGNAVLYKPSEFATLTGLAIGRLLHEAGVPNDVFAVIVGRGEAGAALLEERIDGVFFTGSYATGAKIAAAAARNLIKVQLELGGKDPVYVCDDVHIDTAAESLADGAFYNTGQSCCSVERIYVQEKIFEPFVAAFLRVVKGFRSGPPLDEDTYIGPLTRRAQLDVLSSQVTDALAKGARLLCGGKRLPEPGNYFEPTVLIDVDHAMDVMRAESFGPIIGIQKVRDDDEALRLMNDSEYGLTAGVYTPDLARARAILARVNSGSVYWNCCDRVSPRLPWSGYGHSGLGLTLSTYGIQTFTRPKAWHLRET
jgi:acyl-CoA reductase-like NAD-dependent aldehyde dehydrogenase